MMNYRMMNYRMNNKLQNTNHKFPIFGKAKTNIMETTAQVQQKLEITEEMISDMNETRKWSYFLAILGFVYMGLLVAFGFVFGAILSSRMSEYYDGPSFPGSIVGFAYLAIAAVYFFPVLFLYRFSNHLEKAVKYRFNFDLVLSFKNLKAFYRYLGILSIIGLALTVLMVIVAIAAGLFAAFMNT